MAMVEEILNRCTHCIFDNNPVCFEEEWRHSIRARTGTRVHTKDSLLVGYVCTNLIVGYMECGNAFEVGMCGIDYLAKRSGQNSLRVLHLDYGSTWT